MVVDESEVANEVGPPGGSVAADPDGSSLAFPAAGGWLRTADVAFLAVVMVVGLALRFTTRSPMWLDEALTVNLAKLPVDKIPAALRHDGHPPLYYVLLHYWMQAFGESNLAARSLAGVFGVATVPLAWLTARRAAGRSAAWSAVALVSILPFALRYSTENRMYSLVMVLVLVAWLLCEAALERPRPLLLSGLALCTAALLWTHYWAIWLGVAAAVLLVIRWVHARRQARPDDARATLLVLAALAAGALLFVPWVPSLLYQAKHTGTPWASRSVPTTILSISIQDLGGGGRGDQVLFGWFVVIVALVALFGRGRDATHLELDLRGRSDARPFAALIVLTLAIASAMILATNSAFQSRYDAVWVPFVVVLAGMGVARFRGPWVGRGVLVVLVALAVPGAARNVTTARTQARQAARVIAASGHPGDLVLLCPDQLGPSLLRELPPGFVVGAFPDFARDPHIVDWVDYRARVHAADPRAFADALVARRGTHQLFVVWSGDYRTHTGLCEAVIHRISNRVGDPAQLLNASDSTYEHENVFRYPSAREAP